MARQITAQYLGPPMGHAHAESVSPVQWACQVERQQATLKGPDVRFRTGTKQPAEKGQLIFLNGGDRELFDRFAAPLDVMGKAKFYLGPV